MYKACKKISVCEVPSSFRYVYVIASLPFGHYQIILLGDGSICSWTTYSEWWHKSEIAGTQTQFDALTIILR